MEANKIALQNNSLMSDDVTALCAALILARGKMYLKESMISSFNKNKYSSIDDIMAAIVVPLGQEGLWLTQYVNMEGDKSVLHTRVIHAKSGQWMEDKRLLVSEKPGNQGMGSAQTYSRRYAIEALLCLGANDDDGSAEEKYIEQNPKISINEINELKNIIRNHAMANSVWSEMLREFGLKQATDITVKQKAEIIKYLNQQK